MADLLTKCPKCGQNLATGGPKYCDGYCVTPDDAECAEHKMKGEHLYSRCECGYATNFRRCLDYKPELPKPQPNPLSQPISPKLGPIPVVPKPEPKPAPKPEPKAEPKRDGK